MVTGCNNNMKQNSTGECKFQLPSSLISSSKVHPHRFRPSQSQSWQVQMVQKGPREGQAQMGESHCPRSLQELQRGQAQAQAQKEG
mmetsp:Transcript_12248/g.17001  ORF Transcript_12248/g.17001 Transcript_12248/m.17001 type:complete len:86 (-) Transcript_12248:414-671(-)